MFLKTFLLALIILASNFVAQAQPNAFTVSMPNKKKIGLAILTVNNQNYISFKEVAQKIFPGSILISGGTEISFKNTLLRIAPSTPSITYENPDGSTTADMNFPALKIGQEVYVPVPSFLYRFEDLGIYNVGKADGQKVFFFPRSTGVKPQIVIAKEENIVPDEEDTFTPSAGFTPGPGPQSNPGKTTLQQSVDKYKPKLSPVLKSLKNGWPVASDQNTEPINTVESTPQRADTVVLPPGITPNHYMLPRDLRRRALERKKDGGAKEENSKNEDFSNKVYYQKSFKDRARLYASLNPMPEPDRVAISDIEINEKKLSTEVIFKARGKIEDYHKPQLLKKNLLFRIPNALLLFKTDKLFKNHSLVRSFKGTQIRDFAVFNFVFRDAPSDVTVRRVGVNKIVLEIFHSKKVQEIVHEDEPERGDETDRKKNAKDKWKLDVIVLDPGHGGEDHGATSLTGEMEKDITLSISKKVEKLLKEKLPETKVILTRRDDRFVELYRRGQIANESKGKLFISIHCNSMPKKPHPAKGFESYILRPGRNDDAVRVADRENSAVKFEDEQKHYKSMTDEQLIIATMAQSAFVKFSEHFAELLQREVAKATPLHSRGVNQAGFFVLVGASMPNVLFETAFLSNKDDEEYLTSEKGQQKIAEGIARAIERYAGEYGELLKTK